MRHRGLISIHHYRVTILWYPNGWHPSAATINLSQQTECCRETGLPTFKYVSHCSSITTACQALIELSQFTGKPGWFFSPCLLLASCCPETQVEK